MTVGVMRVVLHLPESGSLKSKRQVVSGLARALTFVERHSDGAQITDVSTELVRL
ncbi:MAG: DUF503 domain-containing protein [Chloroflexi bacterium]|nr:MAG: DUF503 domain-containing protein [Chloroflexota bacterium]